MTVLSLISASAVLVGAGSWGADEVRLSESKFTGHGLRNTEFSETIVLDAIRFDRREDRGDGPPRFVMKELKRDLCGPNSTLQLACILERLDEESKERVLEIDLPIREISGPDDASPAIVPVPAAAPLLLSALAGLAFASRGRRDRR